MPESEVSGVMSALKISGESITYEYEIIILWSNAKLCYPERAHKL